VVYLYRGGHFLAMGEASTNHLNSYGCRRAQGLSTGVVYLYRRGAGPGSYVLSQRLTANASAVTGFAAAIALAADGSVLLASQADDAADGGGAAYPTLTFVDVGNRTMQPGGPLPVPGGLPPGALFGQALALAGDGSQVAPGPAPGGRGWGGGRRGLPTADAP
jgi:hypothetical protein